MPDTLLTDPKAVLDPIPVANDMKANAWDAYSQATSPDDFKARFDKIALPDNAKADLWDMKFKGGISALSGLTAPKTTLLQDAETDPRMNGALEPQIPSAPIPKALGPDLRFNPPLAAGPSTPIPDDLKSDAQKQNEQIRLIGSRPLVSRTGGAMGAPSAVSNPLDFVVSAPQHILHGVEALAAPAQVGLKQYGERELQRSQLVSGKPLTPMTPTPADFGEQVGRGVHELATGGFEAATPFIAADLAAAPLRTLGYLAGAGVTQKAVEESAKASGMGPNTSAALGDVSALGVGLGVRGWNELFNNIEIHNLRANELTEHERASGLLAQKAPEAAKRVLGAESIPVEINGRIHTVEPLDAFSKDGRPQYQVVDPDGKTVVAGKGSQVSDFLGERNAKPLGATESPKDILDQRYAEIVQSRAEAQSAADKAKATGGRDIYAEAAVKDADEKLSGIQRQRAQFGAEGTQLPATERPQPAPPPSPTETFLTQPRENIIPLTTDEGTAFLHPTMEFEGDQHVVITDEEGEPLVAGAPAQVAQWMEQHAQRGAAVPAQKPQPVVNDAEYQKAYVAWHTGQIKAILKYINENPGATEAEAKQATQGTYGVEPQMSDYKAPPAPPEAPAPEPEPEKPTKVGKVSAATPNAPTAATPTTPESPETIALQIQQMGQFGQPVQPGQPQRRVVMFPGGQGMPDLSTLGGLAITHDSFGNTYAYRKDLIDPSQIHNAAKNNTLPEILGHSELGMGVPDKSEQQDEGVAVTAHAPDGTEIQTAVSPTDNIPAAIEAAHAVTPEGGHVTVKTPAEALGERQGVEAPPPPAAPPAKWLDSLTPDQREAAYVVMREIRNEADRANDQHRALLPPHGQIAVGGAHMDPFFRSEALNGFLSALGHGAQPFPAAEIGNTDANYAIEKFNKSRGNDYVVHRALNMEQPHLEELARRVTRATEGTAGAPQYDRVADNVVQGQINTLEKLRKQSAQVRTNQAGDISTVRAVAEMVANAIPAANEIHAKITTADPKLRAELKVLADQAQEFVDWAQTSISRTKVIDEAKRRLAEKIAKTAPAPTAPLPTREAATQAKDLGIDAAQYDTKTVEGRKDLTQAIHHGKTVNALTADADAAAQAMLDRLAERRAARAGTLGRPAPVASLNDEDLTDLTVLGAEQMLHQDGEGEPTSFETWSARMMANRGPLVQGAAEFSNMSPDDVLRTVYDFASEVARDYGVTASPLPAETGVPLEGGNTATTAGLEAGGPGVQPAAGSPQALGGVSPEDVQGTGQQGTTLPSGDVGGGRDVESHDGTLEAGDVAGQGGGNSVPTVVPAPRGGRPTGADVRTVQPPNAGSDFVLTPEAAAAIDSAGARTKARDNLEAIRTIKKIQAEGNRPATLEEQQALAKYVGWGASELANGIFGKYGPKKEWQGIHADLQSLVTPEEFEGARESTINAHYTRRDAAAAMWDALISMGLKAGASVAEPGMGVGNFFMMMPESLQGNVRRTGIELDLLTGSIAKALFPTSNVLLKAYQDTDLPDNYFDAFIGNVPFQGGITIYDPAFKREPYLSQGLHNYFFAKSMTKMRPGGVMIMITSRYTMDKGSKAWRQWMSRQGELLGAIRLPGDTFKANAGTSVTTDVLIIRKRVPGEKPLSDEAWTESRPMMMVDGGAADVNEYFQRHPEMMMGVMNSGTQNYRGEPELQGAFSIDRFRELLATLPADVIPAWASTQDDARALAETYPGAEFVKPGNYAFLNGALVRREGAYMEPVDYKGTKLDRAKGLIAIRGAAREVLRAQLMDLPEAEYLAARQKLNDLYDAFVATKAGGGKTFGFINDGANRLTLGKDADWPLLSSLEEYDPRAKKAIKKNIFYERTNVKPQRITSADTGSEALAVSLNDHGRLDWDRMQELTGRTPAELQHEMKGMIFQDPTSKRWETRDEYLSGNVRQKLRDADFAALQNADYAGNVEALKGVQPRNLLPGEIDAPLGATWVPGNLYARFALDVLKAEDVKIELVPITGGFAVKHSGGFADNGVANNNDFGNAYFKGMDLFEMALNGQSPVARDEIDDFEGNTKMVKNPKATVELVEKQNRMSRQFASWLWSDPSRALPMAQKYNEDRNNLKLREYDGSHQTFPGLNKSWLRGNDLDSHQKNAIWRIVQNGNTLLAHAVGAGKTLEVIVAAMEMKRLGLMRKQMIAVPNYLVGQWRDEFLRAYPGAQILVPTKADFEAKNRKRLMSQIATGNYDAVIVGHNGFGLLPVQESTFHNFMESQVEEVDNAIDAARSGMSDNEAFKNPTVKQLVRRKKTLEEKIKKRLKRDKKDNTVTFEELGVDGLFIDEAHAFKNLGYMTMMDRIAGLPNTDADRSTDMLLKSQYVTKLHGGKRGLVFATGTPVSNSLAEVWTMMRYLMPDYLRDNGFDSFDAWAKTFGQRVTSMEVAPEGNRMISRTRFSEFVNAPELMNMFRLVADVRTKEQLNLPTPAILTGKEINVIASPTRSLKSYIASLGERADAIRSGSVKPDEDNMLKVSSDGRKASLDLRLVDPSAKEDKESKTHLAIRNILALHKEFDEHKAAQLVFLDLSTPKAKAEGKAKKKNSQGGGVANADDSLTDNAGIRLARGWVAGADEGDEEENEEADDIAVPAGGVANADTDDESEDIDLYGEKEDNAEDVETDTEDELRERNSVYANIKHNLIKGGIPANEIAFIHDANTPAKRTVLFEDVREGRVRVLIGSTEKMGAGMNVQQRLIALHHLDAPWRPSDWEQRNGRIDRQGNKLWDDHGIPIRIFRYMTESSFDSFMWQTIAKKWKPISRFMNGDPSVRRIEEPTVSVMSAEEAIAVSSGNPEVSEKIILDQEIQRIEIMRGVWLNEQAKANETLAVLPAKIRGEEQLISALNDDIATVAANDNLVVNGQEFKGQDIRKGGSVALVELLKGLGDPGNPVPVNATYRGFPLEARPDSEQMTIAQSADKSREYTREKQADGNWLYFEVTGLNSKKDGIGYHLAELGLRPLSKTEAEGVHFEWNRQRKSDDKDGFRYGSVPILTKPNLRLVAKAHAYAVSVNYEAPAYTIASADNHVRGISEELKSAEGQLGRYNRETVELESKRGQPFEDDARLEQMYRRQQELAEKLGENKDDAQAVGFDEDDSNPKAPLLKDPGSAMKPEWFPSRKMFVAGDYGTRTAEKVRAISDFLGVLKVKGKAGRATRYVVIHMPTGERLACLEDPIEAVALARQLTPVRKWNTISITDEDRREVRAFHRNSFVPPTETPAESVARLSVPYAEEPAEKQAGPITRYTSLKRKIPTPELNRGDKGWVQIKAGDKTYSAAGNGGATYVIQGEVPPPHARDTGEPRVIAKLLAGKGTEQPVQPTAFSTSNIVAVPNKPSKPGRIVWFNDGTAIDGRYYDDVLNRFPGATFLRGPNAGSPTYVADLDGQRVGMIKVMSAPMPKAVKYALGLPRHGNDTRQRRLQPLGLARPNLRGDGNGKYEAGIDAKYEASTPSEPGHVYVNASALRLVARITGWGNLHGIILGDENITELYRALRWKTQAMTPVVRTAINRLTTAIEAAVQHNLSLGRNNSVSIVQAGPGVSDSEIEKTENEEAVHQIQFDLKLAGAGGKTDASIAKIPAVAAALQALRAARPLGYSDQEALVELGAVLLSGQYGEIDYDLDEATDVLRRYLDGVIAAHGPEAGRLLKGAVPQVRTALGKDYVKARWNGNFLRQAPVANAGEDEGHSAERPDRHPDPEGQVQPEQGLHRSGSEADERADRGGEEPSGSSITLGSGFGALQPGLEQLYERDIKPAAKTVTKTISGSIDEAKKLLAPDLRGPAAQKAAGLLRERGAERDQRRDRALALLAGMKKHFLKMPEVQGFRAGDVWNAVETGQISGLSPTDLKFARAARSLLDSRWSELNRLGLLNTYIENYLPRSWKDPEAAEKWVQSWQAKRPMAGREDFRRRRTYPTMQEGLDDPDFTLVPKFDNPVDMLMATLGQMDASITAHRAVNEGIRKGDIVYVPVGKKAPAGLEKLDDKIFKVAGPPRGAVTIDPGSRQPGGKQEPKPLRSDFGHGPGRWDLTREEQHDYLEALKDWRNENVLPEDVIVHGQRIMGNYYAVQPYAQVIKNDLAQGIGGSAFMGGWRSINNFMNALELSLSYYHGLTTTLNASFSDMALGIEQALAGKPGKAAVSVGRGLLPFASAVQDVYKGSRILKVWDMQPEEFAQLRNTDPQMWAIVDALKAAGAKARQDSYYQKQFVEAVKDEWGRSNFGGALLRAVPALAELVMKPIMEGMVPRVKLSAFAKLAAEQLQNHPTYDRDQLRQAMGQIWNSIDNRFGQLVQRNLMMHTLAREVMNAVVGRPGWNLGSVQEILGGTKDLLIGNPNTRTPGITGNVNRLLQGKSPQVSHKTAYLLAMFLGTAFLSAVTQYILTGKFPEHWVDLIAPQDGGVTEDGRPSRIIYPSYLPKDIYSYATRFTDTVAAKSSPLLSMLADIGKNRDFFDRKIHGDRSIGWLNYFANELTPYSLSGLQKNRDRHAPLQKQILPLIGIMPASKRVGLSPAERMIAEYQDEQEAKTHAPSGPRDKAKLDVFLTARKDERKAYALGQQYVKDGKMAPADITQQVSRARKQPLVADYRRVNDFPTAMRIYDAATDEEKKLLKQDAFHKANLAASKPWEWNDTDAANIAWKYFHIGSGPRQPQPPGQHIPGTPQVQYPAPL